MKRWLLLLLLLGLGTALRAQDLIVMTDNTQISARVLEISPDEVSYKRYSNLDGPTYRLPVNRIRYIEYPNGERDAFQSTDEVSIASTTAPEPILSDPEASPALQTPHSDRSYRIGDYYERNGVRGIVMEVSEDGRHGVLISLDEVATRWDTFEKEEACLIGAADKEDGRKNMAALAAYIEANKLTWELFPAFDWCRRKGEGWYLPAIDELLSLAFHFNGGSRQVYNREARLVVNNALKEHGGRKLDRLYYYYASTEQDERMALTAHMDVKPPYFEAMKKNGMTVLVRAFYRF